MIKWLTIVSCTLFVFSFSSAWASGGLLLRDMNAANRSLNGGAVATQGKPYYSVSNPALLNKMQGYIMSSSFQRGAFENNYSSLFGAFKYGSRPLAVTASLYLPQSVESISDRGESLGEALAFEYTFGVQSADHFKIKGQDIYVGYGLKLYHSRLDAYSSNSVATDLGFLLPFNIPFLRLARTQDPYNLRFGFSVVNLGTPIKFDEESESLPTALNGFFSYSIYQYKRHSARFFTGARYYLFDSSVVSAVITPSAALEYEYWGILAMRAGLAKEEEKLIFSSGFGVSYNVQSNYQLDLDYNYQPASTLGDQHAITVAANLRFRNFKERAGNIGKTHRSLEKEINTDIVEVLHEGIRQYSLKHGSNPERIDQVLPYLGKFGYSEMPKPTVGEIAYDPTIGHVSIVDSKQTKYETEITMVDGSKIRCDIIAKTEKTYTVKHEYGTMTINRSTIASISNTQISSLDKQILTTVQSYIDRYKQVNGTYPSDFTELQVFMQGLGVERIPEPMKGRFRYKPENGSLTIETNGDLVMRGTKAVPPLVEKETVKVPESKQSVVDDSKPKKLALPVRGKKSQKTAVPTNADQGLSEANKNAPKATGIPIENSNEGKKDVFSFDE